MALSPEVYAAYKAALSGQTPQLPVRGMNKAAAPQEFAPLNLPKIQMPEPPKPTFIQDVGNLAREGMDTSQANVQRALTHYGVGDWQAEEQANRELAAQEGARVSPETQQAMQDLSYDDSGLHGVSARGLAGHIVKGVANVPSLAGTVGGVLQAVPHPLVKAAGFALGGAANALDIGGSAAYDVEQQGGSPQAQAQAINEGALLGAGTGAVGTGVIGKVLHGKGNALTKVATGAIGEGLQEYPEEAGQQVVENRALLRPTFEGAHEAGMLGATIGAATGGLFGGAASGAKAISDRLKPVQDPNAANQTGTEIPTSSADVPFTRQGLGAAQNIRLTDEARPWEVPFTPPTEPVNPLKRREEAAMDFIRNAATPQERAVGINAALQPTDVVADSIIDDAPPIGEPAPEVKQQVTADITQKLNTAIDANPLTNAAPTLTVGQLNAAATTGLPFSTDDNKSTIKRAPAPETRNPLLKPQEPNVQENIQAEITPQREAPVEEVTPSAPSSIEAIGEELTKDIETTPITQADADEVSEDGEEEAAPDNVGMQIKGVDSYYLPQTKKSVKKPAGNSSVARNAVAELHKLTTGEEATPEFQADGSFKVGEYSYNLEKDGDNYRVVPATGFDSTYDVTLEYDKGSYKTRVDNYTKEAGETQTDLTAKKILNKGVKNAKALSNAKVFKDMDSSPHVVAFDLGGKNYTPVTVSALRELGASLNDRPNDSIDAIYENVKDGLAYTIAKFGPLKTSEANLLDKVIADAGGLSNTSGKDIAGGQLKKGISGPVTFRQMMSMVNADTRGELAASRREKTFKGLSIFLNKKLFGKTNAPAAQVIAILQSSDNSVAQELVGELKNNPSLDWKAWLTQEQSKARAAAKNTEGGEIESKPTQKSYIGKQESGKKGKIVEYEEQSYDIGNREFENAEFADKQVFAPSMEDVASNEEINVARKPSVAPVERAIPQSPITNYSQVSPKVTEFLKDMLATLRIPQGFTLADTSGLARLPKDVQEVISSNPEMSQFIAMDSKVLGNKAHYIYLAPGAPAQQAIDLAHELGHFVQRNVLDHIVDAVQLNEDKQAAAILAGLMGVEIKPGENPMNTYKQMSQSDKDIIDEMFADRLAEAMLRKDNAFKTDAGTTFADVVQSKSVGAFFDNLAKLLKGIYKKMAGAKAYTGNFDDFLLAMTGRVENIYSDVIAQGGRTAMIRGRESNRTQFNAANRLRNQSQIKKMMDSRTVQSLAKGVTYFYGTTAELHSMKSTFASWLARQLASKTGDISRGAHGRDYLQLLHNYNGQLAGLYEPLVNSLPLHGKNMFGLDRNTPQGNAFIVELHKWLSQEAPLEAIPANLNFTVEETNGGQKNVTMNIKDTVARIRDYWDAQHAFETETGAPLQKRENYHPKYLGRETVLDNEAAIRNSLTANISYPMWKKENGNWVQEIVKEDGWSVREANNFIERYRNGIGLDDMPFAGITTADEVEEKSQAMSGKVSIFNKIFGPTKHAAKSRKISDVRWLHLAPYTEADPTSVILQRAPQAAKTRAMDDKFGSWVVKNPAGGASFTLLDRAEYKMYVKRQYINAKDAIVELMGYDYLTDEAIAEAADRGESTRELIASRNLVVETALDPETTGADADKAKDIMKRVKDGLSANYYDPVGKIELALANAIDKDDISQQDAIRIKDVILPAMFGRLGQQEMGSSWRAVQSYIQTAMNVVFLPLAVLSSMAEPAQIGIRMYDPLLGENMWKSQGKMLSNIGQLLTKGNGKSEEAQIVLKQLGLIKDAAIEHALTGSIESEYIPMGVKKFNAKFFEITQLKRWTDFVRRLAYISGKDAMKDYAAKAMAGNPQAIAQAKSLGLDIQAATSLSDADWIKTENFQKAIYRWVEEATLRPGADTRPARASDPRMGLLWYLKDFPWAMQARTIAYVMQQSKLQPTVLAKMTPYISAAIPLLIAGAIGSYAKDLLTNQLPAAALGVEPTDTYKDAWTSVTGAMKKSGMLGIAEMPMQFLESYEHKGLPWIGAVSPVASVLQDAAIRGAGRSLSDKFPIRSVFSKPVRDAMWSYGE